MYPIKFENIYFEKVWGGRDLEKFRDNLPKGDIGESWDIACHDNGTGVVANGSLKGKNFKELIKVHREDIFGKEFNEETFPLLIKLINSNENLSVQVHPNDEYGMKNENSVGKTECWYVIDAKEDASLIIGTKDCSKEVFEKAIENGNTEDYLNKISVKKGDFFFVPSGMVHAICEGVVIAEIQQNSDITYRVYDYGRPREIHVEKALDVIDFSLKPISSLDEVSELGENKFTKLCECEYFAVTKVEIEKELSVTKGDEFYTYTCVDGKCDFIGEGFNVSLSTGDSVLIPSQLSNYKIEGKVTLLKSTI